MRKIFAPASGVLNGLLSSLEFGGLTGPKYDMEAWLVHLLW